MLYLQMSAVTYGSVPVYRINCVPEGGQLHLTHVIYNPHDNFTNLTVNWFRSKTETMTSSEMISNLIYHIESSIHASIDPEENNNCTFELYRDTFILTIVNFTRNENGYYWCQIVINNTYTQPSPGAWFYADEFNSTHCNGFQHYFTLATSNETQCAQFMNVTPTQSSKTVPTATDMLFSHSFTTHEETPSTEIQHINQNSMILYITVSFAALILMCGIVVIVPVTIYLHQCWKKQRGRYSKYSSTT